ncbi:HprK-related kinase B [Cobetia sp. L2A1]|uniref:HprK-related kinase B n=1 Tax=Cobetia sp. L2A1 TaxID=2686360 RepID=UPI00131AC8F0|nr:HprK-related kinase B [Cobetia sp. L2A1]
MNASLRESITTLGSRPFAQWRADECFGALSQGTALLDDVLYFKAEGFRLCLKTDHPELLTRLADYFRHCAQILPSTRLHEVAGQDVPIMHALSAPRLEDSPRAEALGLVPEAFVDWQPEPGKTRRKDAIIELVDARLIFKVRTGMCFLRSREHNLAFGPCADNESQIINFLLTQHMSYLQHQGGLICHASAIAKGDRAVAIAAFSGGGKSTTMVAALEHPALDFISNDRVFIMPALSEESLEEEVPQGHLPSDLLLAGQSLTGQPPRVCGIAKLPRINPGTMLNNPRLRPLLTPECVAACEAMPIDELWDLEDKHDLIIPDVYGPDRIRPSGILSAVLILNWTRGSQAPLEVKEVDVMANASLMRAVMKTPGPFHQLSDGRFIANGTLLDPVPYLARLKQVRVLEVTGGVDFARLIDGHLNPLLEV